MSSTWTGSSPASARSCGQVGVETALQGVEVVVLVPAAAAVAAAASRRPRRRPADLEQGHVHRLGRGLSGRAHGAAPRERRSAAVRWGPGVPVGDGVCGRPGASASGTRALRPVVRTSGRTVAAVERGRRGGGASRRRRGRGGPRASGSRGSPRGARAAATRTRATSRRLVASQVSTPVRRSCRRAPRPWPPRAWSASSAAAASARLPAERSTPGAGGHDPLDRVADLGGEQRHGAAGRRLGAPGRRRRPAPRAVAGRRCRRRSARRRPAPPAGSWRRAGSRRARRCRRPRRRRRGRARSCGRAGRCGRRREA